MDALRILVAADVPPDPNAGASGTVFQMNAALRRLGHEVEEIWGPELGRRIQHGNLHYLLELPLTYRKALRQRLKRTAYDVVEFNQPHAYLAAAEFGRRSSSGIFVNRSHGHEVRSEEALAPWRASLGVKSHTGLKRFISSCLRKLLDRQWAKIARSADAFHVSCRDDAEFIQQRYSVAPDRIGVVTQGIPESFCDQPAIALTSSRMRRMLYVGQLAFFKAPMVLAAAVSTILGQHPEMTMSWVCSASHHIEAAKLVEPAVRHRVTFLDWMSQESLRSILDEHGVFLFPSFFEGFGKAPLEAMARGLCVVASDTGGMRDFIVDGVSGRLVPIGQPALMVEAVNQLVMNFECAQKISLSARETAIQHRWDRCAVELTEHYHRWLEQKKTLPAIKADRIPVGISN